MPGFGFTDTDQVLAVTVDGDASTNALPSELITGRFGHQVTRLDVCPADATDCSDPRYLVTGGLTRFESTLVAQRVAEIIYASGSSRWGDLMFDEECVLPEGTEL